MYILNTKRDSKLSFSKRKTDILIKIMEASQTLNHYDYPGAKKNVVWKYFGIH